MSNPTIVVVPAAWHQPAHYAALVDILKSNNWEAVTARLCSVGSKTPSEESAAKDASFIRDTLLVPLADDAKDIVLLMHSFGCSVGASAAKGLSRPERAAAGKKGGVVGLIFMSGLLTGEGSSLRSLMPNEQFPGWIIQGSEPGQLDIDNPKDLFYNGSDDAQVNEGIAAMLPQAERALSTPNGPPAWLDSFFAGRRAYIMAALDRALPLEAQEATVQQSGVEWDLLRLDAPHSVLSSHLRPVADFIMERSKLYAL